MKPQLFGVSFSPFLSTFQSQSMQKSGRQSSERKKYKPQRGGGGWRSKERFGWPESHLKDLTFSTTDCEVLAGLKAAESDAVDDYDCDCDSLEPAAEDHEVMKQEKYVLKTHGLRVILMHCLRRGLLRSRYFSEVGANWGQFNSISIPSTSVDLLTPS